MERNVGRGLTRTAWIALGIGMLLRLAMALAVPIDPISDQAAYETYATNILNHGVYGLAPDQPGAYWAVGTAALAAAAFYLTGGSFVGILVLNLIAGFAMMVLVYQVARDWFGQRPAELSVILVALWPNLILFTSTLSSEPYFIALFLGGLRAWQLRGRGIAWLLLAGLLWGLACYVRPVALLVPVALIFAALPKGIGAMLRAVGQAAVMLAVILAVLSPWTLRNYRVFGEFVLVSTNFGPNFWMGNNPDSDGGYMPLPERVSGLSEIERAKMLQDEAKAYVAENPGRFVVNTLTKAVRLHERETIGVVWTQSGLERIGGTGLVVVMKLLATGYWYLLLGLAFIGIAALRRHGSVLFHPLVISWGYFTAIHAIIVMGDRYHMPAAGVIAILAALGAHSLHQRLRPEERSPNPTQERTLAG